MKIYKITEAVDLRSAVAGLLGYASAASKKNENDDWLKGLTMWLNRTARAMGPHMGRYRLVDGRIEHFPPVEDNDGEE